MLRDDGLGQCSIQHVGGLNVLCEWPSVEAAKLSLETNKEVMSHWMKDFRLWEENISI